MAEHAVDNRETEDRNLYPLPSNNDITVSARRFGMCIIKYYTMKTILTFTVCFFVTFFLISVLISASAAEPVAKPAPPPADCSCGVCEDSR
jgi:accessory gene regulator protein AgrB